MEEKKRRSPRVPPRCSPVVARPARICPEQPAYSSSIVTSRVSPIQRADILGTAAAVSVLGPRITEGKAEGDAPREVLDDVVWTRTRVEQGLARVRRTHRDDLAARRAPR